MTENLNGKTSARTNSYFRYMLVVLAFVVLIDAFSTTVSGSIAAQMADTFFPTLSDQQQNSILQFGNAVVYAGLFVVFLMQHLADKIGRKKALAITVIGMSIAATGMFISQTTSCMLPFSSS